MNARSPVYLDYNATAPVRPEVVQRMREVLAHPCNPSSVHRFGREAKKRLEDSRKIIADAISAWPDEITFTASGTEANATALRGIKGKLFVSAIEHSSVLKAREDALTIPVTLSGIVDLAALEKLLAKEKPALVSVMLANNETGVIQPIAEISALCKKHGALLHCDAVQALGKIPVDFGALGADYLTIAGHKCGGPVGAAALVARRDLPFIPLLTGGGQEKGRRAGTENLPAIAGFARAVELFDFGHMKQLRGWLDAMEHVILSGGRRPEWKDLKIPRQARDDSIIFGRASDRLPNTSCVAMPGRGNEVQLIDFDLRGFAVSAGSACSSGRIEPSHVLRAMGVPESLASCAIRISGGWRTTEKDISDFTALWISTCERLASAC